MSKNSGVNGKTVPQLSRSQRAEGRRALRESRSIEKQLQELAVRPGLARRERLRLAAKAAAS